MLKKLFGSWLIVIFIFATCFFGAGFYLTNHPGSEAGLAKGSYVLGSAVLLIWFINAAAQKENE